YLFRNVSLQLPLRFDSHHTHFLEIAHPFSDFSYHLKQFSRAGFSFHVLMIFYSERTTSERSFNMFRGYCAVAEFEMADERSVTISSRIRCAASCLGISSNSNGVSLRADRIVNLPIVLSNPLSLRDTSFATIMSTFLLRSLSWELSRTLLVSAENPTTN